MTMAKIEKMTVKELLAIAKKNKIALNKELRSSKAKLIDCIASVLAKARVQKKINVVKVKVKKAAKRAEGNANKATREAAQAREISKNAKKKAAKKTTRKKAKNKRTVGVIDLWIKLFVDNEKNVEGRKLSKVLTDSQISNAMHKAFPDRSSKIFNQVNLVRSRFNRNLLFTHASEAPKGMVSRRYEKVQGDLCVVTARGVATENLEEA